MKNKISAIFFVSVIYLSLVATASAQYPDQNIIGAYRQYKEVSGLTIKVPTVVEVPVGSFLERLNFAVFDKTTNQFEPHFFKQEVLKFESILGVSSEPYVYNVTSIMDGNQLTYGDFALPEDANGFTKITLTSPDQVSSSMLSVLLDTYVALPTHIEITASVNGQNKTVLAKTKMEQATINFPKTSSDKWVISFWYSQPLRVSELKLVQDNSQQNIKNSVRFLAQPGHSYRVYFDPDRYVSAPVGESGNLFNDEGVKVLSSLPGDMNDSYRIADSDGDRVPDISDNCVSNVNPDQIDVNGNNRGDVCDDFDQDGLPNSQDNCINNPNRDQRDIDGDGIGDACDGQESRLTEQYPWIPWVGIGFAALVLISLFAITAKSSPQNPTPNTPL